MSSRNLSKQTEQILSKGEVLDFGDKTISLQSCSVTYFSEGKHQSYKINRTLNNLRRRPADSLRFSHASNVKLNDRAPAQSPGTLNFMNKDTGAFGWKWWREVNGCQYPSIYQITTGLKNFYVEHLTNKYRLNNLR